MKLKIDDICQDNSIYPREQVSRKAIDSYIEALKAGATFPPIEVQKIKDGDEEKIILLDGFHRWNAYKEYNEEDDITPINEIECIFWRDNVVDKDERLEDLRIESVKRNITHGVRLKENDIQFQALRIVKDRPLERLTGIVKELAGEFSLSKNRMSELIGSAVASRKTSRDAIIYRLYLLGWTQKEIGAVVGLDQSAVAKNMKNFNIKLFHNEYESGLSPETIASSHNLDLLGWTQREIGDVIGLDQSAVTVLVKKFDIDLFNQEYKAGISPETIASNPLFQEIMIILL